jgi:hypothetical protein
MDGIRVDPVADWREWRLTHAGLTWRAALPEDAVAITSLIDAGERRLGRRDRPDLFAPPVILTLVAEDAAGVIVDGVAIELVADVTKFTDNRQGFAAFEKLVPVVGAFLDSRKIRVAQMWTPLRWTRAMARAMARMGFDCVAGRYAHWMRRVRG